MSVSELQRKVSTKFAKSSNVYAQRTTMGGNWWARDYENTTQLSLRMTLACHWRALLRLMKEAPSGPMVTPVGQAAADLAMTFRTTSPKSPARSPLVGGGGQHSNG